MKRAIEEEGEDCGWDEVEAHRKIETQISETRLQGTDCLPRLPRDANSMFERMLCMNRCPGLGLTVSRNGREGVRISSYHFRECGYTPATFP